MTEVSVPDVPRWRWLKRAGLTLVALVVVVWVLLMALLFFKQDDLLFMPRAALDRTPQDVGLPFEDKVVETDDGETLAAWWIPHERPRCTVIHFHGNAGDRSGRLADA